jgi:hypothetical protein
MNVECEPETTYYHPQPNLLAALLLLYRLVEDNVQEHLSFPLVFIA